MATESFEKPGVKITIPDITPTLATAQYKAIAADGTLAATAGTGGVGILQNAPAVGQNAEVMVEGITKAKAGSTPVVAGNLVTNETVTGYLIPAVSGDYVIGMALTSADTAGDIFALLLLPGSGGQLN